MRNGFTIYTISDGDGVQYFTSKAAAVKAAKEALKTTADYLDDIEIEKCTTVVVTLETLLDILRTNGGSWCASSEVVEVVRRR